MSVTKLPVMLFFITLLSFFTLRNTLAESCGGDFSNVTEGFISFNSEDYNVTTECWWNVTGSSGSVVKLVFQGQSVDMDANSSLAIFDQSMDYLVEIFTFRNDTSVNNSDICMFSLSDGVVIVFRHGVRIERSSSFNVSFWILSEDVRTTVYDLPSGIIQSNGTVDGTCINFAHTYVIDAGHNNRISMFLIELSLNDANGDFVAIGNGKHVMTGPRALMMSGYRTSYNTIMAEDNYAFIHLFSADYGPELGFAFYYNTSYCAPPTDKPPTTVIPVPFNATISYDPEKDNFTALVYTFAFTIQKYAIKYCNSDDYPVTHMNVTVTEVAYPVPCLVFVFFISLEYNDTCLGHVPFRKDDYYTMLSKYGSEMENLFGRSIMDYCSMRIDIFVLTVTMIFCISISILIVIALIRNRILHKKLGETESRADESEIKKNPLLEMTLESGGNPYINLNGGASSKTQSPMNVKKESSVLAAKWIFPPSGTRRHRTHTDSNSNTDDRLSTKDKDNDLNNEDVIHFDRTLTNPFSFGVKPGMESTVSHEKVQRSTSSETPRTSRKPKKLTSVATPLPSDSHIYDVLDGNSGSPTKSSLGETHL